MPVSASPFHDLSDLEGMTATQYPPMIFRVSGSYTCLTSLNGCISSSPLLRGTRCCCARDTKRAPLPLSYVPEVCEDCKSTPVCAENLIRIECVTGDQPCHRAFRRY